MERRKVKVWKTWRRKVLRHGGARQMETVGRQRDNSVRVYRVYVLNTLQETEHTLRDESGSRWIELPSCLTKRLSPCLCLSICLSKALSASVCWPFALSGCLFICPSVCLFSFDGLSRREQSLVGSPCVFLRPYPSLPGSIKSSVSAFSCLLKQLFLLLLLNVAYYVDKQLERQYVIISLWML